jgi:outer membrane protein assembly factor BamB
LLDGTILDDRFSACNGPTDFRFTLPERLPGRPFFVLLEVWHLLSGHGIESIHAIQYPGEEEPRSPRRTEPDGSPTKPLPLPSIDARLGPRLRDLAVSPDGRRAVVTAFNLEDNLYGLDLETGGQRWWHKAGHHFAYAPQALKDGFAVTGFDFATAEGYHLYRFDGAGHPQRRYALYGLPKRGINWAFAGIHADSICNFAAAADGSWVAAAGDLGLAVWDAEGKLLWSQDWWAAERKTVVLLAAGDALIVGDGIRATAYDGRTGKIRWLRTLAPQGRILGGRATPNARTVALRADTDGGRVFVLRDGEPVAVLPVAADDLALAADGGAVAVVIGREVRWYEGGALQWTLAGDDLLFAPRLRADGSALAVCSQLGTVYVLDARGTTLDTFDLGSVAAPAWLPDGDLVLAAWQGFVVRRDVAGHRHRWVSRLTPSTADVRGKLLAAADVPTTRRTGWGNATAEPLPLTPNLLAETRAIVQARLGDQAVEWQHNPAALTDGKAEPPPGPWLAWSDVQMIDSGWRGPAAVVFDTFRTQLRVTDVTFVEDAAKPHSWCRDVLLQVWDPRAEQWRDVQRLLSDAAVHSHHLAKPAEGARFRLVSTGGAWPVGNLRWGEVVFHGTALGPSHPDALAKQPVAVLFDEDVRDFKAAFEHGHNPGFQVRADVGAFRGSHYLAFDPAAKPEAAPAFQAPFGHALPGWDFPIAENPGPGEYRYLQFACKALVPAATQATLQAGPARFTVKPEGEWRQYRIDLWELAGKKPFRLQDLRLGAAGGAVAFDRILLGRGGADLPPVGDGR